MLNEVPEVANDLSNVGDDDEPEKFDELANSIQVANNVAHGVIYKNFCLASNQRKKVLLHMRYKMSNNRTKHESEVIAKKLKTDMVL